MKRRAWLLLCGISLLWGSGWVVAPQLAQVAAPYAAAALTFAMAACALLLFSVRYSSSARLSLRENAALSLPMLALPTALLIASGQHGAGGWTPLLYSLLPLMAAGGRWSPAMAVAPGAVLLLLNGTVSFAPHALLWAVPVLAAVGLQAWALRRLSMRLRPGSVTHALGVQCALAAFLFAGCSFGFDPTHVVASLAQWSTSSATALILMAICGTALPYAGLYSLLSKEKIRPEQAGTTQWLQTLVAVGESATLALARPSWALFTAALLLFGCCFAVWRSRDADEIVTLGASKNA